MGIVYEAYDCERKQPVAFKTLLCVNADAIYRFKREFRSLAEMVHPNLVPLYELFLEDDQWFFTMELIADGEPFPSCLLRTGAEATASTVTMLPSGSRGAGRDEVMDPEDRTYTMPIESLLARRNGPLGNACRAILPWSRTQFDPSSVSALQLAFHQLAEGVQGLHAANKLHRDLKPGNVLRRSDGRVVILDFGLVLEHDTLLSHRASRHKAVLEESNPDSGSGYEADSRLVGTLAYMLPEQAASKELSEASDWYAVGVMLFGSPHRRRAV